MPTYTLRYTKKDVIVKNFLETELNEITTSNIVELAIIYFYKTNSYMPLGTVSITDEHPEKKVRTVYIQRHSEASEIIAEFQKMGKGPKKLIGEIIENGVDIGDSTNILTFSEYLIRKKELNTLTTSPVIKTKPLEKSERVVKNTTQVKTEPSIKPTPVPQPTQSNIETAATSKIETVTETEVQMKTLAKEEPPKSKNQKQVLRFADDFFICGSKK